MLACGLYLYLSRWTRKGELAEIGIKTKLRVDVMAKQNVVYNEIKVKDESLLLDTPGCQIPKLHPFDPSLKNIIAPETALVCPGKPLFLFTKPNATVVVNETILKTFYNATSANLYCNYRPIIRMTESAGETLEDYYAVGNTRKLHYDLPLNEDFIEIECNLPNETLKHYIPLVPLKNNVERKKTEISHDSDDKLNVIILGVDSVSALNFQRQFQNTRTFLERKLSPFKLNGYTKVGDNTFPNIVPLLTGHFVSYYWNETLYHTKFFDDLNFVWKLYSAKGYRTFFAEDSPRFGTFNYGKRGFRDPPTDYYYRPMAMAIDERFQRKYMRCINSQIDIELILNYLKDFVRTMDHRPYFSYAMVSTVTHDHLNRAGHADLPVYRILTDFWERGVLNKSLLIVFSDHGIRFGPIRETYIGKFEERMPFIYINYPKWFLEKHPQIVKNLRDNQDRLTTHFDVHATLVHLLLLMKLIDKIPEAEQNAHGLSLMGEIPTSRTCEDANIFPHWCPCQQFQNLSTSDNITLECANAIVSKINMMLEPYKNYCVVLELENVTDAQMRQVSDIVLKFVKKQNIVINQNVVLGKKVEPIRDYLITIAVKPSRGVFESTVRHRVQENVFEVLGISRINAYGNQSMCIQSSELRKFCYCFS
ncbi:uncharacterized protein LOC129226844 [Uloborus diversus]|uniref:uncharacterized protein LOC129226844 n=1 Tax=Uloborus diversus TaxID=327109 RepID=UPI0024093E79|nr:uncharacterized protein LOC129226844 [Uloborus diversus]